MKWSEAGLSRFLDFSRERAEFGPALRPFQPVIERLAIFELNHLEPEPVQCCLCCFPKLGSRSRDGENIYVRAVPVHQNTGARSLCNLG